MGNPNEKSDLRVLKKRKKKIDPASREPLDEKKDKGGICSKKRNRRSGQALPRIGGYGSRSALGRRKKEREEATPYPGSKKESHTAL